MNVSERTLLLTEISKVTKKPVSEMLAASNSLGENLFIAYCYCALLAAKQSGGAA